MKVNEMPFRTKGEKIGFLETIDAFFDGDEDFSEVEVGFIKNLFPEGELGIIKNFYEKYSEFPIDFVLKRKMEELNNALFLHQNPWYEEEHREELGETITHPRPPIHFWIRRKSRKPRRC